MRAIDAADALFEAALACDSWTEVGPALVSGEHGRHFVTVYFDTEEDAAAFKNALVALANAND